MSFKDVLSEDIYDKVLEMDPNDCKSMLLGGMIGFGLACLLFEEEEEKKEIIKELEELKRKEKPIANPIDIPKSRTYQCKRSIHTNNYDSIRISFKTKEEADEVLYDLREYVEGYRCVTVKDLYEFADLPSHYSMYKYGWENLDGAKVEERAGYYVLSMPPAELIK